MNPCTTPLPTSTLVDYWLYELADDELDRVEEHLLGCAACHAASASVATIARALRDGIPPVVSPHQVADLRQKGLRIVDNAVDAGRANLASFRPDCDVLLHHLRGLVLDDVTSVDLTITATATGAPLLHFADVPVDVEAGEVLVACQRHFAVFPPDITCEVRLHRRAAAGSLTRFAISHRA